MANTFKVGDHVTWNSKAGHVSGTIVKVHTKNVNYKGYVHHASEETLSMRSRARRRITSRYTREQR